MVKWGIIGCGDVCEIKSGPAFYKCRDSSLVAVMRRDEEKAKNFALRHHVPVYYSKVEDLIHDPEVDIVYIATPPESHARLAIQALKAGKPVYVEKPMAMNYEECKLMVETAKACGQKLYVAYYRRSLSYFLKVKELLDARVIGKVQVVKGEFFSPPHFTDEDRSLHTWRVDKAIAGGGYFYDMAPHTIDILMFLLGKIVKATGLTGNVGGLYGVEDTVSASFLFDSGVIGSAIWCYVSSAQEKRDRIDIIGEKGSIRFSTFDFSDIELRVDNRTERFSYSKPEHIQQDMIQTIVDEMLGTGTSPSVGETGTLTNWVMDEIMKPV